MSNKCSHIINPLMVKRNGTGQTQRWLAALQPHFAPVDERNQADLLVFAQQLAQYIKFYDETDSTSTGQNWQPFFSADVSAVLAVAAVQSSNNYKQEVNQYLLPLKQGIGSDADAINNFGALCSCVATLAQRLHLLQQQLPANIPLQTSLQNLIQTKLNQQFTKLIAYHKAALAAGLTNQNAIASNFALLGAPAKSIKTVLETNFSNIWITNPAFTNWNAFVSAITPDDSIFKPNPSAAKRLYFAVNHNFFSAILVQFLKALSKTVTEAQQQLEATLNQYSNHEPHMALYLAFIQLFTYVQKHLNTLTQSHLNLYYQHILQLKPKNALPNHVHLIFEPAKHINRHLLPKGTLFKAGKDSTGNEALYALDHDLALNKTTVTALSSVYFATAQDDAQKTGTIGSVVLNGRLFASPVANSGNGLGAEITNPQKEWHPFAAKTYQNGALSAIAMPQGTVGFAIASQYLYLCEGQRMVFVYFECKNTLALSGTINATDFEAAVSTEKGWHNLAVVAGFIDNYAIFYLPLPATAPAITPFNTAVHTEPFNTADPVLKIWVKHHNSTFLYRQLLDAVAEKYAILTISDNVRNLYVQTDAGTVDPSKPFYPFGAIPEQGAALTIGCHEIFQKKNTLVYTKISWQPQAGTANAAPTATAQLLNQGIWTNKNGSVNLFAGIAPFLLTNADTIPANYNPTLPYGVSSTEGFMRFVINANFGHKTYTDNLTLYLIDQANGTPNNVAKPTPPYTPVISGLSLAYLSYTTAALNTAQETAFKERNARFYHLCPFGVAEQHPFLQQQSNGVTLLPLFGHENTNNPFFIIKEPDGTVLPFVWHEAEFYIGLQQAELPAIVSLLFQVNEGSANPLVVKPQNHVHWSFMANNQWVSFNKQQVEDQTLQLTQSGIIAFSIPAQATNNNTLMPQGKYWLRAAVVTASDAVCNIIALLPQAATASFIDQNNAPDFLTLPLPAQTISKPLLPDAALKKVNQPFAAFGGRVQETMPGYYTRVSERLRHKDRGVAVWDYERLILEAFPGIYRAKCLPHTHYEPANPAGTYNEMAPGHVTVVTIPNLKNQNAINPLKPYTNVGELEKIAAFLHKRIGCFVKLHVRNPIFEQVRVDVEVKFYPQYDVTFYSKLLQEEITQFLSPWAFNSRHDIAFGGQISKSVLINFMEERYYVDYLQNLKLYHLPDEALTETDKEVVQAVKAAAILVSAPPTMHIIKPIPENPVLPDAQPCGCQ